MRIGIDIDDTITKTTEIANNYLKEFKSGVEDYHNLKKEDYDTFMYKYIDKILLNEKLRDGVQEAFKYLKEHNYEIIIITARNTAFTNNMEIYTKKYLKEHNLEYDKIIFNHPNKGEIAKENNIDIFIDDKEIVLESVSKYNIECIRFTENKDSKFKSFDSWNKIIEYISSKEG